MRDETSASPAPDATEANRMAARRAFLRGGLGALPAVVTLTAPWSAMAQAQASVNCFTRVSTQLANSISTTPPNGPNEALTGPERTAANNFLVQQGGTADLGPGSNWGNFVSEFTNSSACALSVAAVLSHRHTDFV